MKRKNFALSVVSSVVVSGTYIGVTIMLALQVQVLIPSLIFGAYLGANILVAQSTVSRAKYDENIILSMDVIEGNRLQYTLFGPATVMISGLVRLYGLKAKRNYDAYAKVEDDNGDIYTAYACRDGDRFLVYDEDFSGIGWRKDLDLEKLNNDYVLEYELSSDVAEF